MAHWTIEEKHRCFHQVAFTSQLYGPLYRDQSSFPHMVHFVWPGVKVHLKPVVDQTTNNSNLPENMGLFLVTAGAKVCDPNTLSNQPKMMK